MPLTETIQPVVRRVPLYPDVGRQLREALPRCGCIERRSMVIELVDGRRGFCKPMAWWICMRTEVRHS